MLQQNATTRKNVVRNTHFNKMQQKEKTSQRKTNLQKLANCQHPSVKLLSLSFFSLVSSKKRILHP
jgi:hypothetical protein